MDAKRYKELILCFYHNLVENGFQLGKINWKQLLLKGCLKIFQRKVKTMTGELEKMLSWDEELLSLPHQEGQEGCWLHVFNTKPEKAAKSIRKSPLKTKGGRCKPDKLMINKQRKRHAFLLAMKAVNSSDFQTKTGTVSFWRQSSATYKSFSSILCSI